MRPALAALVAFTALAACGKRGGSEPVSPGSGEIVIEVENQYAASVTIYLDAGGTSRRLGQVNIGSSQSFPVAWRQLGTDGAFRLRAEVIGSSERVMTDVLRVQPDQIVRWTLAPQLGMSAVMVH